MNKNYWVSDHIEDSYKKWKPSDVVTITAQTGTGKSYFIKNNLYEHAKENNKKILMLVNRRNLKEQFVIDLLNDNKLDGTIDVQTYQYLEGKSDWGDTELDQYDYIVSDEMHYFFNDSSFNRFTDIAFDLILDQTNAIKVFMSATSRTVKKYLNDIKKVKTLDYDINANYNFINSLTFYEKDDSIHHFINDCIKNNQKAIFFIYSAEKAYNLHKQYKKYSLFDCGKGSKYHKHVDQDKINRMLQTEYFDELILFTTTTNDNGISFSDAQIKTIVLDGIRDIDTIRQCIGRKRYTQDDIKNNYKDNKIDVVIKNANNQNLGGNKRKAKYDIEMADYLLKNNTRSLVTKYKRRVDKNAIIYDYIDDLSDSRNVQKRVNEMAYYKRKVDISNYKKMMGLGRDGFKKFVSIVLEQRRYSVYEEEENKETLEEYLDSIAGEKLFSNEQKELSSYVISQLIIEGASVDYRTKTLRPSTLENILREQLNLKYAVSDSKQETRGENRGKRYIVITKLK